MQRFVQHLQQVRDIQRLCNVAVHARIQGVVLHQQQVLAAEVHLGRQGGRLLRLHPEGLCQHLAQLREEQRLFAEDGHTSGARLLLDIRPVVGGQDDDEAAV